ncbi:MAG TPA: response regulator transcription factor [Aliidongia sp.]|nr:response regulator transcription factor [Aliidongia sp.]
MKILVVEDQRRIARFVCAGLREGGCTVDHCDNGDEGFARARETPFDVIVLDVMLPGRDGLSVLKGLRAAGDTTAVILLTARTELHDRIEGLDSGADDYLAKPFYVEELLARIHAVARRATGERQSVLAVGELRLDRVRRAVTWRERPVDLTRREFNLLEYLMRSAGRVLTRTQLLEHVWEYDFDPTTNLVDVCVQRIRKKLHGGQCLASPIESVRGVGYRMRKPGADG